MRIAVTGSKGQLGTTFLARLPQNETLGLDLPEHDLLDLAATVARVGEFAPEVVIHTAAMTDVDGCERDPERAYLTNVVATRNIAVAAERCGAALVYIGTDYVFDGAKGAPYWEYDAPNPLSVYGRTKWLGEQVVRDLMNHFYIARIAWLYGAGPRNFVRTVLHLADEGRPLRMVTDEVGSPTYAADVADALLALVRQPAYGLYHLPNTGVCSRFGWAQEILRLGERGGAELIPTLNYQRAARVPRMAELRNLNAAQLGITMRPWQAALAALFDEMQGTP
ncbi:MAG: dTDP-4-dehydrorhamnose reductase [Chloroflexota bacterium]